MNDRYIDKKLQAAHENACDCLYYGYGKDVFIEMYYENGHVFC